VAEFRVSGIRERLRGAGRSGVQGDREWRRGSGKRK